MPNITVNTANIHGRTPLYEAAFEDHYEVMKLLIEVPHIGVSAAESDVLTSLHHAAATGNHEGVELPRYYCSGAEQRGECH